MTSRKTTAALILTVILTATASVRAGEVTPESTTAAAESTVTISGRSEALACEGLARDEALRSAQDAQRAGAHAKAAQCFRVAGDHMRANRAQIRASADTSAASAQRFKTGMDSTKAQMKRLREAFR